MILEIADIRIAAGKQAEFDEAMGTGGLTSGFQLLDGAGNPVAATTSASFARNVVATETESKTASTATPEGVSSVFEPAAPPWSAVRPVPGMASLFTKSNRTLATCRPPT